MNSCKTYQEQMNLLAGGGQGSTIPTSQLSDLSRHTSSCPACSHHALCSLLILGDSRRPWDSTLNAAEKNLLSIIDRKESPALGSFFKAAAIVAITVAIFAIGRWTKPTQEIVKEIVVRQPSTAQQLPKVSIESHEYAKGFLAGRTLVVQNAH